MQSRKLGLKIHETYVVNISLIYDFFFNKGEDPEAMLIATKIAMEYRQKYAKGIFIEEHCSRRWGHNELDDKSTFVQTNHKSPIGSRRLCSNIERQC